MIWFCGINGAKCFGMFLDENQNVVSKDNCGNDLFGVGNVERKCGTRAYQSGDENNPSVITDGTTTIYPLATPTTEQHPSIAIPKLATKCTDANGMEIDIERNN